MSRPRHFVDPDEFTPRERTIEVAAILAAGCLRLVARGQVSGESAENSPEASPTCLEDSGKSALMDPRVDGTRERRVHECP